MANLPGKSDVIQHFIHDTKTVLNATPPTLLTYFKQPGTTQGASNLRADGRFPSPESFLCHTIKLAVPMGTALADVNLLYNATATVTLYVGKTWYIDHWTLNLVPISIGLAASGGGAGANVYGGAQAGVSGLRIAPPVPFSTDEVFSVEIRWGTAPAVSADVPLQVILGGTLTRQVQ